jgi:hypothetical protein
MEIIASMTATLRIQAGFIASSRDSLSLAHLSLISVSRVLPWRPATTPRRRRPGLSWTPTLLWPLVTRRRHLKYESFAGRVHEDRRSTSRRPTVHPRRAQYYRWLSGQLKGGTPYPDACRVLEAMFQPWTAAELFGPYDPTDSAADATATSALGATAGLGAAQLLRRCARRSVGHLHTSSCTTARRPATTPTSHTSPPCPTDTSAASNYPAGAAQRGPRQPVP